jgi:membrane protein required for colicin V production
LSWIDILLGGILLLGAIRGYREGFVMEIISLLAIFLGVLAGFKLLGNAMILLNSRFDINQSILPYVAFAVVFLIIVIVVNLFGKLIKASIGKSFLGGIDQLLGAVVGLIKGVFMLSVVLWILDSMKLEFLNQFNQRSKLLSVIAEIAPQITSWVGSIFPFFEDILPR